MCYNLDASTSHESVYQPNSNDFTGIYFAFFEAAITDSLTVPLRERTLVINMYFL